MSRRVGVLKSELLGMLTMSGTLSGNMTSQELAATSCPRCMEARKRTQVHDVTAVLQWRTRVHSVVTLIL